MTDYTKGRSPVAPLHNLANRLSGRGWNGVESHLFRVSSEEAKAFCVLVDRGDIAAELAAQLQVAVQRAEKAEADAKFSDERWEHIRNRSLNDPALDALLGRANIAAGYTDDDFDLEIGKDFIANRYAFAALLERTKAAETALQAANTRNAALGLEPLWDALKRQCCATPPDSPDWDKVTTCVQVRKDDLARALLSEGNGG